MKNDKYSIIFSTMTGNTKELADAIRGALPAENCEYWGLSKDFETATGADAYTTAGTDAISDMLYIGFWTDRGHADAATLDLLSKLEGKKIFLFGTAGFGGSKAYFDQILSATKESIGESNTVVGEFMCQGKMPQSVKDRYMKMKESPDAPANLDQLIENWDRALTHPDADDLAAVAAAVKAL